jgi:hypothetical protein
MKTRKVFYPEKYYKGLSKKKKIARKKEIQKFGALSWKNPKAYVGFQTDKGVTTKSSSYTKQWKALFPKALSLKEKAAASGVPEKYLLKSYNRGLAAWRTGHRPGATPQQWGYGRVHSLLMCGKTYHTADSDIVREAIGASTGAAAWWSKC